MLGCVSYRGYFSIDQAQQLAKQLRSQGHDVFVASIPAYSTLGWFDDPLLNTFMHWPIGRVAELMFHELAHQRLFIADDTEFNESFASAVGQLGAELWLQDKPEKQLVYRQYREYRNDFLQLMTTAKTALIQLYRSHQSAAARREAKEQIFEQLRAAYQQLKNEKWNGYNGYDAWFEKDLNNAKFVALSAYNRYVPAFINLFHNAGDNFAAFYQAVEQLGRLTKKQRKQRLQALLTPPPASEQSLTSAVTAKAIVAGS
jgi:predicted aminopeptidase